MQEFDFVLSDMALEVIGDFAVVWLLSPKKSFSPQANTAVARYINRLPGHCLQVSPYQAPTQADSTPSPRMPHGGLFQPNCKKLCTVLARLRCIVT